MKRKLALTAATAVLSVGSLAGMTAPAAQATTDKAPARSAVAQAGSLAQVHTYTAASGVTPPAELIGPNGENPKKWGVATFPANAKGSLASRAGTGGGTWMYGTGMDGRWKGCYSNYVHPSKKHSASVAIAPNTDKEVRQAGKWARAYAKSGAAYKCYAYWGVY
ncbi:lactococcin 972 family bacteriocin [Streptomyces tubercidicus]